MADFPTDEGQSYPSVGATPTTGILLSASSAGYKGPWSVISTGLAREVSYLAFCTINNSTAIRVTADVGIGAAGSEVVLIPDILIDCSRAAQVATPFIPFWVSIPANTAISARICSTSTVTTINSYLIYGTAGFGSPNSMGACWAFGVNSTAARGTAMDPGTTANTKSTTWTVLSTGVNRDIRAITVVTGQQRNAAQTTARWQIDVGIGASSAVQTILGDLPMGTNGTSDQMTPQVYGPFSVNIPSGTRLSARTCSSTTDATDRLFDLAIYGMG